MSKGSTSKRFVLFLAPWEDFGISDPLGKITGQVTRAGHGHGLPRAQARAGKFRPVKNPRPRARVGGQARVFFFVTESRRPPLPPPSNRPAKKSQFADSCKSPSCKSPSCKLPSRPHGPPFHYTTACSLPPSQVQLDHHQLDVIPSSTTHRLDNS